MESTVYISYGLIYPKQRFPWRWFVRYVIAAILVEETTDLSLASFVPSQFAQFDTTENRSNKQTIKDWRHDAN